jgi:hypothetical protein
MATEKKDWFAGKSTIVLEAKAGKVLPVRYQNAWVRVRSGAPVELVIADLPYEAKIEIRAALDAGEIFESKLLKAEPVKAEPAIAKKA